MPAELSKLEYRVLNLFGIAFGTVGLLLVACILSLLWFFYLKIRVDFTEAFDSYPTRILYLSMLLSIPYSICYIWSSAPSASNQAICAFTITGTILFLHLMNGTVILIILHCAILLSSQRSRVAVRITWIVSAISVLGSFVFAFTGLSLHAYSYSESQATCWIFDPDRTATIPKQLYGLEVIILYGPLFLCMVLEATMLIYVVLKLRTLNRVRTSSTLRRMIVRLGISPVFLLLYCLMVLGGDLPITYKTSSAMFASFFVGFTGYASFSLCTGICIIFVDPALGICWKEYFKSKASPSSDRGELSEDHMIMSQRPAVIPISTERSCKMGLRS